MLADYTTAPIDEKLRATLGYLRKMTLEPESLTGADAAAVLQTGVTAEALQDAMQVAYLFNIYDRLADTMGWHVPDKQSGYYQKAAQRLLNNGYR